MFPEVKRAHLDGASHPFWGGAPHYLRNTGLKEVESETEKYCVCGTVVMLHVSK